MVRLPAFLETLFDLAAAGSPPDYGLTDIHQACGEHITAHAPDLRGLDCKKGCDHCCHFPVQTPVQSVFHIASHIRQNWSEEEQAGLMDQLADVHAHWVQNAERILSLRLPCPFLDEQSGCRIYAYRPFACRAFSSFEETACLALKNDPAAPPVPQHGTTFETYELATTAMVAIAKSNGQPYDQVFFIPALYEILKHPQIELNWREAKSD